MVYYKAKNYMVQHDKSPKEVQINITSATILKIVAIFIGIIFLYFLRDIVELVLISLLIAVSVDPAVGWLTKRKVPHALSAGLVFLFGIIIVTVVLLLVIPNVISETVDLISNYSWIIEDITGGAIPVQSWIDGGYIANDASAVVETIRQSGISEALPAIIAFGSTIFGGMINLILVLVLSFYMVIEKKNLRSGFLKLLPQKSKKSFEQMLPIVKRKVGSWLGGQLSLMFIMFVSTYVILLLLDIPFALVLALMAGLLDIIPFIGAISVFIPIVLVALSSSMIQAVLVAIALFVNQQIHGDIFTPKIMQKAVGMNPVITIIAILIGLEVAGVTGAILAVPSTMLISIFIHEWILYKK